MFTFVYLRGLLIGLALVSMVAPPSPKAPSTSAVPEANNIIEAEAPVLNSSFYLVRPDPRKCASPMCGGYFVRLVNQGVTRCANGKRMSECYVASIDWNGSNEVEPGKALIRGLFTTRGSRNGKYGVLKVLESWEAVSSGSPQGDFFRVRDLGVRCIAAPCQTHRETKLNANATRTIAGVNLKFDEPASEVMEEVNRSMTGPEGVLAVGAHRTVTGPAGRSQALDITQLYLRKSASSALKPCIKTGCSSQICADETVMSTCEYKAEYACYKKATCERQADGNCGFTKTKELTSCLARH